MEPSQPLDRTPSDWALRMATRSSGMRSWPSSFALLVFLVSSVCSSTGGAARNWTTPSPCVPFRHLLHALRQAILGHTVVLARTLAPSAPSKALSGRPQTACVAFLSAPTSERTSSPPTALVSSRASSLAPDWTALVLLTADWPQA